MISSLSDYRDTLLISRLCRSMTVGCPRAPSRTSFALPARRSPDRRTAQKATPHKSVRSGLILLVQPSGPARLSTLMMEQTDTGKAHHHAIFITCLNNIIVADRAARLSHIFHAALVGPLNIVAKWKECVGT